MLHNQLKLTCIVNYDDLMLRCFLQACADVSLSELYYCSFYADLVVPKLLPEARAWYRVEVLLREFH